MTAELRTYVDCEIVAFRTVAELDFGQERFLEDDPSKLFAEGNYHKVPIMIGRTDHEFISLVPSKIVFS